MVQDITGATKIAVVVLLCSLVAGLIVGFFEGGDAGRRAFRVMLLLGGVVGLMQIFEARFAPLILAGGAAIGGYALWQRRRQR